MRCPKPCLCDFICELTTKTLLELYLRFAHGLDLWRSGLLLLLVLLQLLLAEDLQVGGGELLPLGQLHPRSCGRRSAGELSCAPKDWILPRKEEEERLGPQYLE